MYFLEIKESINTRNTRKKTSLLCYSLAVVLVLKRKVDQRDTFSNLKCFGSMKLVEEPQFDSRSVSGEPSRYF